MFSNPTRTNGFFYDTHHKLRNNWRCWHVNCEDVPRARGHIRDVINTYGKDSNRYRVRVAGLFPTHDDDTVIPLELVEAAVNRKVTPLAYWPIWGVDVARFEDDRSVLTKCAANVLLEPPIEWRNLDTTQVAGRIKAEIDKTKADMRPKEIRVDMIGYGAGVVDQLMRVIRVPATHSISVVGVNVAETASDSDEFHRLRDQIWWRGSALVRAARLHSRLNRSPC